MKLVLRTSNFIMLMCLSYLAFSGFAFAQEAGDVLTPISNEDFLKLLIESIGGLKGASTLAIVGIVVKLLLAFMSSNFFDQFFKSLKGGVKLTIALSLSLVSGVVALMAVNGLSFGAALVHSTTLSAFVVLSNQIYKQFFEKKD